MAEKRYFWLKLKEDFFEEDTLSWIEEQEKGKEYCLFYLKLCLKSLKNEGILIRTVGQMLIPYDAKKLAELTKTDLDTVIVAMELFKKTGLVQVLENGEIYLTQLTTMVGSETSKAEIMRKKREKDKLKPPKDHSKSNIVTDGGNNVTQVSENSYTEKEKDKELDKELNLDTDIEREKENNTTPILLFPTTIHELIFKSIGEVSYKTWFTDTQIIENGELVSIAVKDEFKRQIIQSKYLDILKALTGKNISVKELTEVV
jgi:predicted phage replisome organizer